MYHLPISIPLSSFSLTPSLFLSYLFLLSLISFSLAFLLLLLKYLILKFLANPSYTLLEIITPYDTKQSPFSTEQLFATIHSIGKSTSFLNVLFKKKHSYSLEIVATSESGIRFLIRARKRDAEIIKKNVLSYLPDSLVTETEDYLPATFQKYAAVKPKIFEMKLSNQEVLDQHYN